MGRVTLLKVWDGLGGLRVGTQWVWGLSRRCGTGRETLGEVRDR